MDRRIWATLIVLAAALPLPAQTAKKSDSVVKAKAKAEKPAADGTQLVTITLTVDKNWHLYANPVGNEDLTSNQTVLTVTGADKPQTVKTEYPKGKLVKDAVIGDYNVYEGEIIIKATVKRPAGAKGALEASVKLQACSDKSCLQPATVKVSVTLP